MNRSFYNGVIGSKSYLYGMDVLANNIANVNTYGFKRSDTEFSTLFSTFLNGSGDPNPTSNQIGHGNRVQAVSLDISQGSLINTDKTFDLAIMGDGWFLVSIGKRDMFTRNGNFFVGKDGFLTDSGGNYVLGYVNPKINKDIDEKFYIKGEDSTVEINPAKRPEKIFLPNVLSMPANPTSYVKIIGNLKSSKEFGVVEKPLDANSVNISVNGDNATLTGEVKPNSELLNPKEGDPIIMMIKNKNGDKMYATTKLQKDGTWKIENYDISPLDPKNNQPITIDTIKIQTYQELDNAAHFGTPIVLDNGERGVVKMDFKKVIPQKETGIEWNAVLKLVDLDGNVIDTQEGVLKYDETGALISNSIKPLKRADGGELEVNLGTPYDVNTPNSGYDGIVSMDKSSEFYREEHDGYIKGALESYTVQNNGIIYAVFDNGKSVAMADIPIYHFQNDQGLEKYNDSYFVASANSGEPFMYQDENGKVFKDSKIESNMLESSNVHLSTAMTQMIILQKAFQANSKSITTSDQMIQKAIEMKK